MRDKLLEIERIGKFAISTWFDTATKQPVRVPTDTYERIISGSEHISVVHKIENFRLIESQNRHLFACIVHPVNMDKNAIQPNNSLIEGIIITTANWLRASDIPLHLDSNGEVFPTFFFIWCSQIITPYTQQHSLPIDEHNETNVQ